MLLRKCIYLAPLPGKITYPNLPLLLRLCGVIVPLEGRSCKIILNPQLDIEKYPPCNHHIPSRIGTFEDDGPCPKVGYVIVPWRVSTKNRMYFCPKNPLASCHESHMYVCDSPYGHQSFWTARFFLTKGVFFTSTSIHIYPDLYLDPWLKAISKAFGMPLVSPVKLCT